jgi:hypothetical protein
MVQASPTCLAWHTNPSKSRANQQTLRGVASILKEHPGVRCEVHGETGRANSAPAALAAHLGMHPVDEVT